MAGNRRLRARVLASLAIVGTLASACGRVAAPGARYAGPPHDPDNPYWAGSTPATTAARVTRDPDNPFWTGVWTAERPAVPAGFRAIHDPDNPYWLGR